jgi:hypothetical protein
MTGTAPNLTSTRLLIGLLQGMVLFGLYRSAQHETWSWPATNGPLFAGLLGVAVFIPPLVISGLGSLRLRSLTIWAVAATVVCAVLTAYDVWREPDLIVGVHVYPNPRIFPNFGTWAALAAILFIVHTLTIAGESDGRWIATYQRHFDVAWKHGVQLALAASFLAMLWLLLFLGAELFSLIRIEFLSTLIRKPSFYFPVSALAVASAIHVTDVRANIVRGTRTLLLVLLAWLLPLMALIGASFVLALAFTGLEPLWGTKRAASILLIAAAALVFLINAAHQDGRGKQPNVPVLGYAKLVATAVLTPLIVLAGYALALRVAQYGWTPSRIIACACVLVAALYTVGYVTAALRSRQAMTELEPTNIFTSLAIVGVLIALTTPIADPMRIAVGDQVRRLESGVVAPDHFDFAFLRFGAGRFGMATLERLATHPQGPNGAQIAGRARAALKSNSRRQIERSRRASTPEQRAQNIVVLHPAGATLPESFLQRDWTKYPRSYRLPGCLIENIKCDAVLVDLDGDGTPEILLFLVPRGNGYAFKSNAAGEWDFIGELTGTNCPNVRAALRNGQFKLRPAPFKDLVVGGDRLHVTQECAAAPPRNSPAKPGLAR